MTVPIAYEARLADCGIKHLALYQAVRDVIAEGHLCAGERLPSTRRLAEMYGLSRGSVSLAYEMLAAEGFVKAGVGQGTFAAGLANANGNRLADGDHQTPLGAHISLSAWGRRMRDIGAGNAGAASRSDAAMLFAPQNIGHRYFPGAEWRAVVAACWRKYGEHAADENQAASGSEALRRAIAGRLRRERGIRCGADDVVLTGGSMQAIALLCQLLLEEGKKAVAEIPGYAGIRRAIRATGADCIAGRVDESGIVPRDWEADALFVTPARQFPTGAVLTCERRMALLEWAARRNAWIVEDDYDSEFRWGGRPIEPLKALDREGRVVYVGTFSRSMRTEVRIGYAVVPATLRDSLIAAKTLYEPYPTGITEQRALAEWMAHGGFDRHMRRMRRIYGRLEGKLRSGLEDKLGGLFRLFPADAGLHLYAVWRGDEVQYDQLMRECRERGAAWRDASVYGTEGGEQTCGNTPGGQRSAVFGFAHLDENQIRDGIGRIRQAAEMLRLC